MSNEQYPDLQIAHCSLFIEARATDGSWEAGPLCGSSDRLAARWPTDHLFRSRKLAPTRIPLASSPPTRKSTPGRKHFSQVTISRSVTASRLFTISLVLVQPRFGPPKSQTTSVTSATKPEA